MKKTRILSLILAAAMLCALLSGCMGGKTVMKIGGNAISEEIYSAALSYADNFFQQSYGFSMKDALDNELSEGTTGADMLKEQADGLVKEFESVVLYAKDKGIELTKEEKAQIKEAKDAQVESAGGRKAFLDSMAETGMNEAFFDYIMERQQIYSKLYTELFTGEGEFAPSADEVVKSLEGYARVKHLLIQTKEGDADFAEKKATAEKFLARAKAGEDFDALIKELAETGDGDPGMSSYPNGYVIDANGYTPEGSQMVTEFTTASHALAENAVSELVPSDYGFHIIKRYPFGADFIKENLAEYSDNAGMNSFAEELTKFMENVEIEYTKAYEELDIHKILGVEKTNGAASGDAEEHSADDGHNHGEEAEGEADAPAEGENASSEGGIEVGTAVPAE